MSAYKRYFVPGGTYFFTVVTHERRRILTEEIARVSLREATQNEQKKRPFELQAIVLLPDHIHTIWILPLGDYAYPTRWKNIKSEFSAKYLHRGGEEGVISHSRKQRNERGIWQRRYWEHTIRDEDDLKRHFDYLHYNPVKHGYVDSPADWPYSSFHRWVKLGEYEPTWGNGNLQFKDLNETAME